MLEVGISTGRRGSELESPDSLCAHRPCPGAGRSKRRHPPPLPRGEAIAGAGETSMRPVGCRPCRRRAAAYARRIPYRPCSGDSFSDSARHPGLPLPGGGRCNQLYPPGDRRPHFPRPRGAGVPLCRFTIEGTPAMMMARRCRHDGDRLVKIGSALVRHQISQRHFGATSSSLCVREKDSCRFV